MGFSGNKSRGSNKNNMMKQLVKERAEEAKWAKFDSSLTIELNLSPDELRRS